ncbi:phage portal protein family protein [Endozoicomonas sp. ALC020]|uniref:phage portal protein family protein n=1 Tax=unclassified Endozoicomonas TaxID=2644528 RepID=UPI003BAF9CBF
MTGKASLGEIAKAYHGIHMAKAHTSLPLLLSLSNPDTVLQQRGRDLKLYEEILHDDHVKSCFQQRRLAVTQSECQIVLGTEVQ